MKPPTRWNDPASDAPDDVRALLAAADPLKGPAPAERDELRRFVMQLAVAPPLPWWKALPLGKVALVAALSVGAGAATRLLPSRTAPHSPMSARTAPHSPAAPAPTAPTPSAPAPSAPAPVTRAPLAEAPAPTPPLAEAPAPVEQAGDGAALLEEARRAIMAGHPDDALRALSSHARLYRRSTLAEEREFLRVRALYVGDRAVEARAAATRYLDAHPTGLYAPRVQALMADHAP